MPLMSISDIPIHTCE